MSEIQPMPEDELRNQGLELHDTPNLSLTDALDQELMDSIVNNTESVNGQITKSFVPNSIDPLDSDGELDLSDNDEFPDDNDNDNGNINIDDEDDDEDDFEFLQVLTRESFQHNLSRLLNEPGYAYSTTGDFEPSEFMNKYYKYWSLDELISSFRRCLNEIDQELIGLVNNEYGDFIELGKSIDGTEELARNVKIDLQSYMKDLKLFNGKIDKDRSSVKDLIVFRRKLGVVKKVIDYLLVLNEQIDYVEALLVVNVDENGDNSGDIDSEKEKREKIDEMTAAYLCIHKILVQLNKYIRKQGGDIDLDTENIEFLKNSNRRITGLRIEFKSLLDDYLKSVSDKEEIFKLFKVYQLINESQSFKKLIQSSS